ncbi:hypothetical protein EMCRGX_G029164 [Ephydatia muelleri]
MQRGYLDVTHYTAGDKDKRAQKRWVVLNLEGEEGGVFLDQYDSEYFETTGSVRCSIPLINCRNLEVSKSSPHTFEFTCNAGKYTMGSDATSCSPATSGTFIVTLKQNQVAKRLKFTGRYNLRITLRKISLHEEESDVRVATWTYDQFRTFTSYKNRIEIEAGRKSETGPGVYIFMTPRAEEISQLMTSNIKTLDEKIKRMNAEKEKRTDPFENPNYSDNLFPLTNSHALKVEMGKGTVPHYPFDNASYEENAFRMDSPANHHRLEPNGIGTYQGKGKDHDYEEVEFLPNPAPQKVPAEQKYAEPYANTTAAKEQDVQVVEDYIKMQEARMNALTLVSSVGGNEAVSAAPRLPGEHLYAKLNRPPKPLTAYKKEGPRSPNGAARPEKGTASGQSVNSAYSQEDFENHPEYITVNPNQSYVPAEQPHLEACIGRVQVPASLLFETDDQSVALIDDGIAASTTTTEPNKYAGHFEEIDKMWNETWNT